VFYGEDLTGKYHSAPNFEFDFARLLLDERWAEGKAIVRLVCVDHGVYRVSGVAAVPCDGPVTTSCVTHDDSYCVVLLSPVLWYMYVDG